VPRVKAEDRVSRQIHGDFEIRPLWFTMSSNFVHPTTREAPHSPRVYKRFSDAADDVVDARTRPMFR